MLIDKAAREADGFWTELDDTMLPALRRGDRAAAQASYARLSTLYAAHRRNIDALVEAAGQAQARVTQESLASLHMTIAILVVLGLVVGGCWREGSSICCAVSCVRSARRPMRCGGWRAATWP